MQRPILRVALPKTTGRLFDYIAPQHADFKQITIGMRVKVPFQSRELVGLITDVLEKSDIAIEKLKEAISILDQEAILPQDLYKLCSWSADYYHFPLGDSLMQALPLPFRKGLQPKIAALKERKSAQSAPGEPLPLNEAQQTAYDILKKNSDTFHVHLLDGVTGSGKTEIYLQLIADKLDDDKQVLILLPEISLTPQTIDRFAKRFSCSLAAFHSNVTPKEKVSIWQHVKEGNIRIVIGTRSALFLPFANLSLIIIDEEHDPSFKQQDRLRYHARDLAIMRAKFANIPIVLGSATPSLETLHNAKRERYTHLLLPHRAGNAAMPAIEIIDLKSTPTHEGIAAPLLLAIKETLQSGNQVMLFLNRRGFSPITYCTHCKTVQSCNACDSKLVYHTNPDYLKCHHCDTKWPFPKNCDACHENCLIPLGLGTQRLEETLREHCCDVPIYRIDRDTTTNKQAMKTMFDAMHEGPPAILLGTQMLAKGHHFPNVTLVGMIDIDSGLLSADFRAREHMGQLLLQVAGRAGRAEKPGTVFIQTLQPEHPILTLLIQQGYSQFADYLLAEREMAALPPFSHVALLSAEAKIARDARQWLTKIKAAMKKTPGISLFGPTTATMAKRRGFYREQLIIQSSNRGILHAALKQLTAHIATTTKRVRHTLDVDPIDLS